ncbi:MAG: class B sortase [Candidatus Aphodocola sp.]
MNKNDIDDIFSSDEQSLLDVINASYLSIEDVKWLKSRRWFKRFLKVYSKELKKRYKNKPVIKKDIFPTDEDAEVLDFTKTINIPQKEVIEILDFTKTIDVTDTKDIIKATENAKKKVKVEKTIYSSVIAICSFILVILSVMLVNWYLENKKTNDVLDTIYEVADVKEITTTTNIEEDNEKETTKKIESLYSIYGNMNMLDVNFDNLKSINSDTVGWIKVNGTKINYPFVKTDDNEFYLKHSFDKSSNKKGWVFLDYRNDIDFLSKNTILYAHGLVNNQMFGSMRNVIKPNWYNNKNNHIIKISTTNNNQLWQVFSTYTIEPESYYITTNFLSDEEYNNFIETIKSRSVYDYKTEVSTNDKILTLSSCYDNEKRMVLHAKLISIQNK